MKKRIVVVGAGIAGLSAAYRAQKLAAERRLDAEIVVLEASSRTGGVIESVRKDGYVLDPRGWVTATNPAAQRWLEMGLFDDWKKAGTRTYQAVMAEILGLTKPALAPVMMLSEKELAKSRQHLVSLGLDFSRRPIIGMNTGAGGRWPLKQWTEAGYVELIGRLARRYDVQFVLLGGPGERERHERLKAASAVPLIDSGCDNPVRHFAAIVSHCDLVITGDTLAMHLSLALGRRTVVLFGPTSAAEIELYGLGEKVVPKMTLISPPRAGGRDWAGVPIDASPNCNAASR